jgi:hypothetical protein
MACVHVDWEIRHYFILSTTSSVIKESAELQNNAHFAQIADDESACMTQFLSFIAWLFR